MPLNRSRFYDQSHVLATADLPWRIIHYLIIHYLKDGKAYKNQKHLKVTAIAMKINFSGEKALNTILAFLLVGVSGFPMSAVAADDSQAEPDWPGSFGLLGSETRMAIGGFVQLDVIHDTDAIGAPCQFITGTIPTDGGTPAQGSEGQTNLCINTSRLTFETRTPTTMGRAKTFISVDFFGDALSTSPELRMRQAYAEIGGLLWGGDLLVGQTWGTYVDLEAWPDILDFEGPGSAVAVRQPMIRWSKTVSNKFGFQLALEQPGDGSVQGAEMLTRLPDLIGTMRWSLGEGHLRLGGILRDIRVGDDNGVVSSATGWGVVGSGKIALSASNSLLFEVSYGEGTSAYYGDAPPNGIYDPTASRLELLPLFAWYAGLEHGWNENLSSSLLVAVLDVDNSDNQPDTDGDKSAYASANLIWRPNPSLMFGAEILSGGRKDISGAEGTDNRLQLSSQFSF